MSLAARKNRTKSKYCGGDVASGVCRQLSCAEKLHSARKEKDGTINRVAVRVFLLSLIITCRCHGLGPNETHDLIPRDAREPTLPGI
jgi:hypothetical protein